MSSDPFDKAKKIRKGELDSELPHFDEITGWLQRCPQTWLPALLRQTVASCLAQNVFQDGKLVVFVERCVTQFNEPGHGVLREDI